MKRILVVGTTKNKNVDLIYSFLSEYPDCEFIFIGNYNNILQYPNFTCLTNLTDDELILQYKLAHILLFPSLSEGFGMPIIESQYFGVPVITSKYEPMYSVAGKDAAIFVNPKSKIEITNALKILLSDKGKRTSLINNGYRNCSKYFLNDIVIKFNMLYSSIISHQ